IMVPRIGVTDGTLTTDASTLTSDSPTASPTIAVPMGRPAATTEPKAIMSTISAATKPILSDAPTEGACASDTRSPPNSTSRPAARAGAMASDSWSNSVFLRSTAGTPKASVANPVVPSADTVRPGVGGTTPTTCGSFWAAATDAAMAAWFCGVVSVPVGAWKTIWLLVDPATAEKSALRRSLAAWDWAPGIL